MGDAQIIIGGTSEPLFIHCAGRTIGFTFGISGWGDASIKINGETIVYSDPNNDGGEFASDVVIPLTYMESDIEFGGGMKTWTFSDMKCLTVKGIAELETQIGDIDTALDVILEIQQNYTQEADVVLPGEADEVTS